MQEKDIAKLIGVLREVIFFIGVVICILLGWSIASGTGLHPLLTWLIALIAPLAAVGAFGYVATRFVATVYRLSNREAFDLWRIGVFGPLFSSLPLFEDYPVLIVREGQLSKKAQNSTLYKFGGPGTLVLFADSAAVMEYNGRLTRVVGPSVKFLRHFEQVRETVGLRPQKREAVAKVMTKEGFLLEADVKATFQLLMDPEQPVSDQVPYAPQLDEVKKAARWQTNFNRSGIRNWADRIAGNLDSTLRGIVSDYTLNELLLDKTREEILKRMQDGLEGAAHNFSGRLLEVHVGPFRASPDYLNEEIQRQRVDNWKARRESKVEAKLAGDEAKSFDDYSQVEREAHQQAIRSVIRCLLPFAADPNAPNRLVALRLVETLDEMRAKPENGAFVSPETVETLERLRTTLVPSE